MKQRLPRSSSKRHPRGKSNGSITLHIAKIVFGYEHSPPQIDITIAIDAFEVIAKQLVDIELGERQSAKFGPLVHPVHQQGKLFGWEMVGFTSSATVKNIDPNGLIGQSALGTS